MFLPLFDVSAYAVFVENYLDPYDKTNLHGRDIPFIHGTALY